MVGVLLSTESPDTPGHTAPDLIVGKPVPLRSHQGMACATAAELMKTYIHTRTDAICFALLTIRQGTELVPSNIEIPQGTEATQLHGEGLQLIAAHILGQRRLYKPGSAEIALLSLSSYLPFPSLFWRVLPTFLYPPPKSPWALAQQALSGPCPLFSQAAAGFLRC